MTVDQMLAGEQVNTRFYGLHLGKRRALIDQGLVEGANSADDAELRADHKRISNGPGFRSGFWGNRHWSLAGGDCRTF